MVCGAFVSNLSADGLAKKTGWPSPFTRIGPGFCEAPIPSFSDTGGNTTDQYYGAPGLGVLGFNPRGLIEDHIGTSHSAPLLSRQMAILLHELQAFCAEGTQPFAVTARSFLSLTATASNSDAAVQVLSARTLGYGHASAKRLVPCQTSKLGFRCRPI